MNIVICGSITESKKLIDIAKKLKKLGFEVELPFSTKMIADGKMSLEEYCQMKEKQGDSCYCEKSSEDFIKRYYKLISESDGILVVNVDKKGIKNYIGGNALIEIAFAYVFQKPIYLFNPIPKMPYTDEIIAMKPIVISRDLKKIKQF